MKLNTYLNHFDGQCADAFRFYAQVLGGTIQSMTTHGETPMAGEMPPEWHDRVMHAMLVVGDQTLMGADRMPGQQGAAEGFAVVLDFDTRAEAERIFNTLAENGKVTLPFQETFWSGGFGMLVDRFGTPWMINGESRQ